MDFFSFLSSFNFPFVYSSQHTKMSGFFGRGGANFFSNGNLNELQNKFD